MMNRTGTGRGRSLVIGGIIGAIAITMAAAFFLLTGSREPLVGTDVRPEDITEFYYTYASSADPPFYQRYHLHRKDASFLFSHETREGADWPLTESHITHSGSIELSAEEWTQFLTHLSGGTVRARSEHAESGFAGPWLYLYWQGDQGRYQEFAFPTASAEHAFEAFLTDLARSHGAAAGGTETK